MRRLAVVHIISGILILLTVSLVLFFPGLFLGWLWDTLLLPLPEYSESSKEPVTKALSILGYTLDFTFTLIYDLIMLTSFCYFILFLPQAGLFLIVLLALPSITGGIALIAHRRWGMTLLKIVSFIYLLVFPIGTILAIYSFIADKRMRTASQSRSVH